MTKKRLYWILQLSGWVIFSLLNFLFFYSENEIKFADAITFFSWIPFGILITNSFRFLIRSLTIMKWNIFYQLIFAVIGSFINAIFFFTLQVLLGFLMKWEINTFDFSDNFVDILNFSFIFFVWSLIYFSYHNLINQRKAEIQKLKWEANIKEIELNKLKSQLNPHFMFNSMNSIRALIDEDPAKAKEAVTQLSNILRNTLLIEKNNVIPFFDEIKLVSDYLGLEKIRFEERLRFKIDVGLEAADYFVPPLLIQTLVENGIKHGISKFTNGGEIKLFTQNFQDKLKITIQNTGFYDRTKLSDTGYGIKGSQERLKYLFGIEASILIKNESEELVTTVIILPLYKF